MSFIEIIKGSDRSGLNSFLAENMDKPEFVALMEKDAQEIAKLLLSKKIFPDSLLEYFSSLDDLTNLADVHIEHNYTPSMSFIRKLIKNVAGEAEWSPVELFKHFASLPVNNEFLFEVIHSNCFFLASELIVQKKKSDKPLLVAFFKALEESDFCLEITPEFQKMLVEHEHKNELLGLLLTNLKKAGVEVDSSICEHIILSDNFDPDDVETLCKGNLSAKALRKLHEKSLKCNSGRRRRNRWHSQSNMPDNDSMRNVEWSEEVEKLNQRSDKYLDIDVINPPKTSKFWPYFVARHPNRISDSDLLEFIQTNKMDVRFLQKVVIEVLSKRSLDMVQKLNFELIEEKARLADYIREIEEMDSRTAKYLYDNIKPTYLRGLFLRFLDSKDPKVAFEKLFDHQGLKINVRETLDAGYSMAAFIKDLGRQQPARKLRLSNDFIEDLTKDEFLLAVAASDLMFDVGYSYSSTKLKFKLKPSEVSQQMIEKVGFKDILANVTSRAELIKLYPKHFLEMDVDNFISSTMYEANNDSILKAIYEVLSSNDSLNRVKPANLQHLKKFDKNFTNTYLESLRERISFNSDELIEIAATYTRKELEERVDLDRINFTSPSGELINLRCKDGQYLISDKNLAVFFVSSNLYEKKGSIKSLFDRNAEIFREIAEAYLEGLTSLYKYGWRNRHSSNYWGRSSSPRKAAGINKVYEGLLGSIKSLSGEFLDEAYEKIKNGCSFQDLVDSCMDVPQVYRHCDMDTFITDNGEGFTSNHLVELFKHSTKLKFKAQKVHLDESLLKYIDRMDFEEFSISIYARSTDDIAKFICEKKDVSKISLDTTQGYGLSIHSLAEMNKNDLRFRNHQQIINQILESEWEDGSNTIETVKLMADNGAVFTDKLCKSLLNHYSLELDVIEFISSRIGGLLRFTFNQDKRRNEDNVYEALKSHGAKILDVDNYMLNEIFETLLAQGPEFDSVDAKAFTVSKKLAIIKFIEDKIDPNYKRLNLASKNVSSIGVISSYSTLKDSVTASNEDLIRIFSIPGSVSNNKKLMTAISEHISANPTLPQKVVLFKNMVQMLSESAKLSLDPIKNFDIDDYFDRSGFGTTKTTLSEKEEFELIPFWSLQALIRNASKIAESGVFLRGADKKTLMRFLRSLTGHDAGYLNDIFSMMKTVETGLEGFIARRDGLKTTGGDEDQISNLEKTIASVKEIFAHVAKMDDAEDMHDRLVSLAETMSQDPFQPLNQDKYEPLQYSSELTQKTGVRLFFPKTRGELIELGNIHGWCVSGSSHYGDEVISNGNILVALVPRSKEITIANVVALAHFIRDDKKGYYLEQLRWSKLAQGGRGNVDATKDFDHQAILAGIEAYMEENKHKMRRAA